MGEVKFTPGPWNTHRENERHYVGRYHSDYDGTKASVLQDGVFVAWVDSSEADAHLIAAAPELYEALRGMVNRTSWKDAPEVRNAAFDAALAALAKARGDE